MIEINTPIEDLRYDPVTRKYRVVESSFPNNKNTAKSYHGKSNHNKNNMTFKINAQKTKTKRNLIERKGLHVDFIVK